MTTGGMTRLSFEDDEDCLFRELLLLADLCSTCKEKQYYIYSLIRLLWAGNKTL